MSQGDSLKPQVHAVNMSAPQKNTHRRKVSSSSSSDLQVEDHPAAHDSSTSCRIATPWFGTSVTCHPSTDDVIVGILGTASHYRSIERAHELSYFSIRPGL